MAAVGLASAVQAVPQVGRLDGARGPNLPPVMMPGLQGSDVIEEKLPDGQLAAFLESNGDYAGAALEWQKLAYDSRGDARARALLKAGTALEKHGDLRSASGVLMAGLRLTDGMLEDEMLYALARVSPTAAMAVLRDSADEASGDKAPAETAGDEPEGWAAAARYRLAWQQAEQGAVTETYGLAEAVHLQQTVARIDRMLAGRVAKAGWMSLALPGLGHAWLGLPWVAAAVLALWALTLWLVLWHQRRGHTPYVVLWSLLAAALWSSSAMLAAEAAKADNTRLRQQALNGQAGADWPDLRLREGTGGEAPQLPALPDDIKPAPAPAVTEVSVTTISDTTDAANKGQDR